MLDATPAERRKAGKAARRNAPLEDHADLGDPTNRDPVGLIVGQGSTRVPELLPGPGRDPVVDGLEQLGVEVAAVAGDLLRRRRLPVPR